MSAKENNSVRRFSKGTRLAVTHISEIHDHLTAYMEKAKLTSLDFPAFYGRMKELKLFVDQEDLAKRFFATMDSDNNSTLDKGELLVGFSIFAKGTKTEKFRVCFSAYDKDKDGQLTKKELADLLKSKVKSSLKAVSSAMEFDAYFGDDGFGLVEENGASKDAESKNAAVETHHRKTISVGDGQSVDIDEDDKKEEVQITIHSPLGTVTLTLNKREVASTEVDPYVSLHGDEYLEKLVCQVFEKYDKSHDNLISFEEFETFIRDHTELT